LKSGKSERVGIKSERRCCQDRTRQDRTSDTPIDLLSSIIASSSLVAVVAVAVPHVVGVFPISSRAPPANAETVEKKVVSIRSTLKTLPYMSFLVIFWK
jgi:hypothetical protein